MLYLIGLGLNNDLSIKSVEKIKKCDVVYLETYTTGFNVKQTINFLKSFNENIIQLSRKDLEDDVSGVVEEARKKNVAVVVYGDPLIATTHITLLQQAIKGKASYEIIHNASVLNAITNTGLHIYKFGKIASLPRWEDNYKPESFYQIIIDNQKINAHTLLLIDIGLKFNDALSILKSVFKKHRSRLVNKKIIVCQRLGQKDEKIFYNDLKHLKNIKVKEPFCIIIPSKFHFTESEFLSKISRTENH